MNGNVTGALALAVRVPAPLDTLNVRLLIFANDIVFTNLSVDTRVPSDLNPKTLSIVSVWL